MTSKSSVRTTQDNPSKMSRNEKLEANSLKQSHLQVSKTNKLEASMYKSAVESASKPTNKEAIENSKALADHPQTRDTAMHKSANQSISKPTNKGSTESPKTLADYQQTREPTMAKSANQSTKRTNKGSTESPKSLAEYQQTREPTMGKSANQSTKPINKASTESPQTLANYQQTREPNTAKISNQSATKPTNKGSTEIPKCLADNQQRRDHTVPRSVNQSATMPTNKGSTEDSRALADKLQSKLCLNESKQLPIDVNSTNVNTYQEKKVSDQGVVSPVPAKVSDETSSFAKSSGSTKITDYFESGKSSICRGSNSSDISEDSSCSSFSSSINKPHKANDSRWEAIQAVRSKYGALGLNHFRLLKRLGCGDIGSVYLSELSGTNSYFAIKAMDKASLASRKKLLRAQTEKEILQSLDHPFLPTLYTNFETDKFSCLVMEFCPGGDLHTLRQMQPGKRFTEQAAKFYVAEVLLAMEYLHMLGIVYRDLKPENVLVREDGHVMLSDFDLSLRCTVSPTLVKSSSIDNEALRKNTGYCAQPACIEPSCIQPSCIVPTSCFSPRIFSSKSKKERKTKNDALNQVSPLPELMAEPTGARSMSFVGTHEYLAPEIVKGEGHGSAVDWWTFGIFLYELLFGKTPFKGSGNRATLFNVVGQPLRFPESPLVSFAARDLIRGLLVKEPQNRLAYKRGATEIKQHPFFEGVNWALIRCASPPDVPRPVEIESVPSPVACEKPTVVAHSEKKGSDNYLEFDFF